MSKHNLQIRFKDLIPASDRIPGNVLKFNSSLKLISVPVDDISNYKRILPQLVVRVTDRNGDYIGSDKVTSLICYRKDDASISYTTVERNKEWIFNLPALTDYIVKVNNSNTMFGEITLDEVRRYTLDINTTL